MNPIATTRKMLMAIGLLVLGVCAGVPAVHAQAIASLQLVPSVIVGGSGGTSTALVTLATAAPTGGMVVQLGSSNLELAASVPQIMVAAGQTQASVVVATNALYRRYSGLAFSASISASNPLAGGTVSATLNVTAQARPSQPLLNPDTTFSGPVCTGDPGLLFDCAGGVNGQCTFRQECAFGCQGRPTQGASYRDQCRASGPYPIVTNPKRIVGGTIGQATLQLASGAPAGSFGLVASASLVAAAQTRTQVTIPTGATSLAMPLNSAAVNRIQFAAFEGIVTTPQALSGGGTFFGSHQGRAWVAVVPGVAPTPRLVSHRLDETTVRGGFVTFGTACINQLAPAPEIGIINLSVSSSNSTVARVLPASLTQGGECMSFAVETFAVSANATVNINARLVTALGTQTLTVPLLVTATPGATQATTFFLDPLSVEGGQSSVGTIVLDGMAPAGGFLVTLTSDNPAALILPASVTVPAGTDRVNLTIGTRPVSADVLVTIQPAPAFVTALAQLTVRAGVGAPTLAALSVTPVSVTGGNAVTATARLSSAAPVGGVVVGLSSNSSAASVPPSVTIAAGQTAAAFAVNTLAVTGNTLVTLSANLGSITRLATLTVTPVGGVALAAPALQSPANDARFNLGQLVNFDWSDVAGAASYTLQVDESSTFAAPLTVSQSVVASQYGTSGLPAATLYWRVRAVDSAGNPGAWSAVRQLRVR